MRRRMCRSGLLAPAWLTLVTAIAIGASPTNYQDTYKGAPYQLAKGDFSFDGIAFRIFNTHLATADPFTIASRQGGIQ